MEYFDILNLIYYALFSTFVFYQLEQAFKFQGSSETYKTLLSISSFIGLIVSISFLVFYGFSVKWWTPFVIVVISLFCSFIGAILENIFGRVILSAVGFILWPIFAFLMFNSIPI